MKTLLLILSLTAVTAYGQAQTHAPLTQQKVCDVQARRFAKEYFESNDVYTSHYDTAANVCYMWIHHLTSTFTSDTVYDAFEGREYASYWDDFHTPIVAVCYVKPRGHEKIQCKNSDEFEQLVDKYFGIGR